MQDMTQLAEERRAKIKRSIANREAEIKQYHAELEKLDELLSLANELFPRKAASTAPAVPAEKPAEKPANNVDAAMQRARQERAPSHA